jgi:hypothetical protein
VAGGQEAKTVSERERFYVGIVLGVILWFPITVAGAVLLLREWDLFRPAFALVVVVYLGIYFTWIYRRGRALHGHGHEQ